MATYLLKRLLLIVPTLFGIMLISFAIVQFAPGGPVDGISSSSQTQMSQGAGENTSKYRGAQGLDPEFIKSLEKQFGFDKPAHERFFLMMKSYLLFDFGKSYFRDVGVLQLIGEKMPV